MMRSFFSVIFLCCILGQFESFGQGQQDSLTSYLDKLAERSRFPGFGVAIVDSSRVLYTHAFGSSDQDNELDYTVETIQPIGAISNTFIGVAIMKAIELGFLELDTEVNSVLPFKVINPNMNAKPITIRHLATHTSGILDGKTLYEIAYAKGIKSRYTLNKFLRGYLTTKGRWYSKKNFGKYNPGTRYEYSKMGSTLAAYAVEVAAGMPFDEFTKKHILGPLQMKDTGWSYEVVDNARHSILYADWRAPLAKYVSALYPDGGLRTSVNDLTIYLRDMIRGYYGTEGILSPESYKQMLTPMFNAKNIPKNMDRSEPNEGVFWVIRHNGLIGYTGSDPGVTALMLFDPEKAIGKIFIANLEIEEERVGEQMVDIWRTLEAFEDRVRDEN